MHDSIWDTTSFKWSEVTKPKVYFLICEAESFNILSLSVTNFTWLCDVDSSKFTTLFLIIDISLI